LQNGKGKDNEFKPFFKEFSYGIKLAINAGSGMYIYLYVKFLTKNGRRTVRIIWQYYFVF